MTEFYNGRDNRRPSRPFCARCGNLVDDSRVIPSRTSWAEKGRGLSLEIDGKEGRQVSRRHSSGNLRIDNQRKSPMHCYIIPLTNETNGTSTPTSTYRESFGSPSGSQQNSRHARSTPTSPVSTLSPWSSTSSSSPTPFFPRRQSMFSTDVQSLLSRVPSTPRNKEASFERHSTTYRDHFTWIS
uniref:Uncharacterized protein n=1 Tax=Arion vulgaris TaxID=1028688 RepID=A0A0B7BLI5_9EUPU